jgi:predicted permease
MRAYRLLLHLYPTSFRNEYGGEMCAVFARRRRNVRNTLGLVALWLEAIVDVTVNAFAVHWDILRSDLRYTLRTLSRAPGFTLTAILVVALGVGATTAAFSVTDFVLIRPLPFPDADRLVKLWETKAGYSRMELSPANYRDWRRGSRSFERIGAYYELDANMLGKGEPFRIEGASVSADLFATLGIRPVLGRSFVESDDRKGAPGTVILSYRMWQNDFGGDPGVLGQHIDLDNAPYTIIGVMPREFLFPSSDAALWTTMRFDESNYEDRNDNWIYAVGRLRPGVTLEQVRAEWAVLAARSAKQYRENEGTGASAFSLRDEVSERSRLLLFALSGASACVLLIACANLANLLLARTLERRRELAVRRALGAGRERLVRHLLTESAVLAVTGGTLGICVAALSVPLLARLVPTTLPIAESPAIDARVLAFAAVLTAVTGVVFGLAPVAGAGGDRGVHALREDSRAGGGRKERFRSTLVIVEIVASVVLLVSAGLLIRALWTIQATDPGFRSDGVLTLRTALPPRQYESVGTREDFYRRVLSETRALPGVSNAAYISFLPLAFGGGIWPVSIGGHVETSRTENNVASLRYVTPGYFASMSIPLKRGRDVTDADTRERQFVAVVSESFVRRYLPGRDPIGQRFTFAFDERTIVGVAGDIRVRGLERSSEPQVYLSSRQVADGSIFYYSPKDLVVKASVPPSTLVPALRAIIQRADPRLPISDVRTLSDVVDQQTAPRVVQVRVLGAFAVIALALAAIGIHGVLSCAVSQRTKEIGVRIALGAQSSDILGMVVKHSLWLAAAGIVPGVALAYGAGRAMEALLAGVKPFDGPTFGMTILVAVVMTVAGTLMPTLRALRVDPIAAIRAE